MANLEMPSASESQTEKKQILREKITVGLGVQGGVTKQVNF